MTFMLLQPPFLNLRILFILFIIVSFQVPVILSAQNGWKMDHYSYLNCGLRQSITMTGRHALTDKMGLISSATLKNNLGGGTVGLDYNLKPWLNLGILTGWDIPLSSVVLITSVGIKAGKTQFTSAYLRIGEVLDLYELAWWYQGRDWKAGAIARNYFGVGPRVDLRIPKTPVYLWSAGLYEWKKETYGLMLGFTMSFADERKTETKQEY